METGKKLSVTNVKLSDQPVGFTVIGKYSGTVLGEPFDVKSDDGSVTTKRLTSIVMEDDNGDRTAYLADKGLLQTIAEAQIQTGQRIKIVKGEKRQLSRGRTMNTYDIYAA